MTQPDSHLYSRLRGWTPIAFHPENGTVEWADLRGHNFDQPFFSRTLERWRAQDPRPTVHTDLQALAALDDEPSVEPDLIIAHPSRCGSTLLARLAAATVAPSILISEPEIFAALLNHNLKGGLEAPIEPILRQVVRAHGRIHSGWEGRYIVKLPSNMSRYLPVFRRAFPDAPMVWLQRRPDEILESNLNNPARPPTPLPPEAMVRWIVRRLTLAFMAAATFVDDKIAVLDYRDLALDPFASLAGLMHFEPTPGDLARMHAVTQLHGHNNRPYTPREKQPLPKGLQAIARETLDPMYRALGARAQRRAFTGMGPPCR